MGRTSLLDHLLHRPSQSYSEPAGPSKNYYRAKDDIISRVLPPLPHQPPQTATLGPPPPPVLVVEDSSDDSDNEVFYTPRSSVASSAMLLSSSSTLASSEDALSLFSESPTTVTSHTDFSSSQNHATYTDADWAAETQQNYLKPLSRSAPSSRSPSPTRTPPKPKPLRLAHKKQLAPSLMMSMTAVLEMDDDDAAAVTHGGGKGYVRYTPTHSVIVSPPPRRNSPSTNGLVRPASVLDGDSRYPDLASSGASSSDHSTHSRSRTRLRSSPLRESSFSARRRVKSEGSTTSNNSTNSSAHVYTSTNQGQMPSNGTAHYTSLTLPRAPMPSSLSRSPSNKIKVRWTSNGKIDLTTSGVAQTTMATVEVVAGLSSSSSTKRRSWKLFASSKRKSTTLSIMSSQDASPLAFTSHRPPPSSVPPSHVLVQVWAVGVDCIDGRLAGIRLDRANPMEDGQNDEEENFPIPPAVGFVPGRSFVGRILDCGFDPSDYEETGLKKGEWIVGLCDIRKSGALAEFITIDRHRVHRINQPIMPSLSGPILQSSGRLETLALLALIGVPAYRAIRSLTLAFGTDDGTLPSLTPQLPTDNLASGLTRRLSMKPRGPSLPTLQLPPPTPPQQRKALILRGNTPVGLALIQMLVKRKWTCVAHASLPPYLKGEKEVREWMGRVEQIVRDAGGVEVVFDDGDPEGDTPRSSLDEEYGMYGIKSNARTKARGERQPALRVIDRFREDGDVFDLVIDTIGGKDIWRACEALLATPITVAPLLTPGGGLSESSARSAVLHHVHGRGKSEIGISGGDDHSTTKDGKESIYSSLTSKTGTMTLGRTFSRRYRKNKSSSSTMSKHEQQFGIAQFITLVGDHPLHPIGTAKQHLKAGMRALNPASSSTTSMVSGRRKVNYAWIASAHDVDHEGEDVNRSLEGFLKEGVGIWGLFDGDGQKGEESGRRVVSFDQAPQLLFREASEVLKDGGVGVIRVVP